MDDNQLFQDPAAEAGETNALEAGAVEAVEPEEADEFDELGDLLEEEQAAMPAELGNIVTLITSTAGTRRVAVDPGETTDGLPGVPLRTVLERSGLIFGYIECYAGQTRVDANHLCKVGDTITIVGNAKGG